MGLESYYGQTLTWQPCEPFAQNETDRSWFAQDVQCTRLKVPMNYDGPRGATISLGVLRSKATDQSRRIGSLIIGTGGPGMSGMVYGASLAYEAANTALPQRFDFVGFDPRGVGASEPALRCLTDAERDTWRTTEGPMGYTATDMATTEARRREFGRKCLEGTENGAALLANIGTRDTVRDIDVLRSALGDEKLTYLGYSYGTRIGAAYAERFPGNVRAMVLDGAVGREQPVTGEIAPLSTPDHVLSGDFRISAENFGRWCATTPTCPLNGRGVAELVTELATHPVDAVNGRRLHLSDALAGVVHALYGRSTWERLKIALGDLREHRGGALLRLADEYYHRAPDGHYSNHEDIYYAVHCVDDPRPRNLSVCAFWPAPVTGSPLPDHAPAGLPAPLVISATADPATPLHDARELADAFGGRLVSVEADQHTSFLRYDNRNSCVDNAAVSYLVDLTSPTADLTCK